MLSEVGRTEKSWGHEEIVVSTDLYCLKYLIFDYETTEKKTSMHFHQHKTEHWRVVYGSFVVRWIITKTGEVREEVLNAGDTWENKPLEPHQLECISGLGSVLEISTRDDVEDNYRLYR